MLHAKRRRASKYNINGKQLFSTLNTTVKYKQRLNVQNREIKTECSYNPEPCNCSFTSISNNLEEITGCKTNTQHNPLSGYRKENILYSIADCSKIPTNTVYTDNYAKNKSGQNGKGCSLVVEGLGCVYDLSSCIQYKQYNPTIQNQGGYINNSYNYNTKQYLSRRNDSYTKRAFNYLSKKNVKGNNFVIKDSWDPSNNECYNNSIYNGDLFNRWRDKNKNSRYAVYKPNNRGFSQQGAVSGGARLNRLKYQTQLKAQTQYIKTPNTIENERHNNIINGAYPATLYYNGTPVHKEIISNVKTTKCKRTLSELAQRCHIKSNFCVSEPVLKPEP